MLDIKFIRENLEQVKEAVKNKNGDPSVVDLAVKTADTRSAISKTIEELRAKSNAIAKNGKPSERDIEEGKRLREEIKSKETELDGVEKDLLKTLYKIPNVVDSSVPVGKDESENKVIGKWGEPIKFDFKPLDHLELGRHLDIIDTETASTVAGSRFGYLKGGAVMLEFALVQHVLHTLTNQNVLELIAKQSIGEYDAKPFVPVVPPVMIKPEVFTRMARLDPGQEEERYFMPKDNLYLVGSAEHTLGPMHIDQTLNEKDLPLRYVGFSTSFRREAGSYGKDTSGILRVHQFDKLEIESFTVPENSIREQNFIVAIQEFLWQSLKIPYQVVAICTGDMGGPDYRQIDIEAWLPGQNKYREVNTSDLMTDYQSRRLNTKVKRVDGHTELVHMNDATAFAIGRAIIAILENFQQQDGSVIVPEVLRPYTGFDRICPKV